MNYKEEIYDVIIIGAGVAGLSAAVGLADQGKYLILEKNNNIGIKLLVSGSGKCNIANSTPLPELLNFYNNRNFVKKVLYKYDTDFIKRYFKERGVPLKELENKKIFPNSEKASDILNVFVNEIKNKNIIIKKNTTVESVFYDNEIYSVKCRKEVFCSKNIIITCGGKSYPKTGSDGSGYNLAKLLGHTITEIRPALSSVIIDNYPFFKSSGISFKDIRVDLLREKKIKSFKGDLLLTHDGLSGPVILNNSDMIQSGDMLRINFSKKTINETDSLLLNAMQKYPKRKFINSLFDMNLPESFLIQFLMYNSINIDISNSELKKQFRKKMSKNLSEFDLIVKRVKGFDSAMATAGGVLLSEINSSTMESKKLKGIYFAGEVLDVHGETGGFNIHFAIASGMNAGENASKNIY